ncbi:MAG: transglutaminase domain-containing protein [Oceanospirillales bacterium]|nr:transglutaminase domain-containing protein [Oceanospirillales bacterium]
MITRGADRRLNYRLRSALEYQLQSRLSERERAVYLQLPPEGNLRSRERAGQWWEEAYGNPERFVDRVLDQFSRTFTYTLRPPALANDPIDGFLFDTQQGFCGHYAGALVFLLRSVGVPARVVGGYQGGEWNPYEQYLTVRQYDAHAWTEYWIEGRGWVRVDPTAAVSPERIVESSDRVFAGDPAFLSDAPLARLRFARSGWLVDVRRQLEALNFNWHRWVLNYQGQQMQFLGRLMGNVSMEKMIVALLVPFALVMSVMAWTQLRGRRSSAKSPLERKLSTLLEKLERLGLQRLPNETLQAYSLRVGKACPVLRDPMSRLASCDEAVRYAEDDAQKSDLLAVIHECHRVLRSVQAIDFEERA